MYNTDSIGYNRTLTKQFIFQTTGEAYAKAFEHTLPTFTSTVAPAQIQSGGINGNLNMVKGYMQSASFQSGVNGWKFDAVGNLEANSGTFRGSLYAATGNIGDWVIDTNGIYFDGTGTPSIRTAATVGSGTNGVLIDSAGIKVYDDVLGVVVNLPSDGSAPSFSSGTINETIFEISTNAVLRTSETVGDGTSKSAGVLINNSGVYACEANQLLGDANVRINNAGDGFFKGTISASTISSSVINSSEINGAVMTGGILRTAESGQRTEITSLGIQLLNGATGATYGDSDYLYGDPTRTYGTGVLAYINNSLRVIPFYVQAEQTVADMHMVNRSANPTGPAEAGDLCVVDERLKVCTVSGTPGGWDVVGAQTAVSSPSQSLSPSLSPSVSPS